MSEVTIEVVNEAKKYYENLKDSDNKNNRELSWEHCYKVFYETLNKKNVDYDYLSLHLALYLASWGMYRGSSFLKDRDYKIHIPAVE